MAVFDEGAPVLVAVGEASGKSLGLEWPAPSDLAGAAIKAALADSGRAAALGNAVDCIVAIRSFEDSGIRFGTGSPDNVADAYAQAGGINPGHLFYSDIGGQTPQALVNDFAAALRAGEYRAVLIAGAEATYTAKRARRQSVQLDWGKASDRDYTDLLSAFAILSRTEIRHGVISMPLAYSMIETARRARLGMDMPAYGAEMARLWAAFSQKSPARAHAQFAKIWREEALQAGEDGNYPLTQIYRRWMVAQDSVDVAAALVLTTAGTARGLGIAPDRLVWLAGAAETYDPPISERANLAGSDAQNSAINAALDQAGVAAADLGPVDIYSCFPCAVFAAIDHMAGLARPLADYTLTGGLSFFGGPGNGYALHSLAAMVQAMRQGDGKPAMVTANGGVMSKQAVGIYTAAQPNRGWSGKAAAGYLAQALPLDPAPNGKARVLTYAQPYQNNIAGAASLIVEMENGARAMAVWDNPPDCDLAGQIACITAGEKRHSAVTA